MGRTPEDRRCTAHTTRGVPCQNVAMVGQRVCRKHGGAAPRSQAAAARRILAAADPAAAKLVELMRSKKVPANVQLAAARDLLDRAGLTSTQSIEVHTGEHKPLWQRILENPDVVSVDPTGPSGTVEVVADFAAVDALPDPSDAQRDWIERVERPVSPPSHAHRATLADD